MLKNLRSQFDQTKEKSRSMEESLSATGSQIQQFQQVTNSQNICFCTSCKCYLCDHFLWKLSHIYIYGLHFQSSLKLLF